MDVGQQDVGLFAVAGLVGIGRRRLGRAMLEGLAHLLDQRFQHADLAREGFGGGHGAGLDGLGQFGEGALGRLHGVGQQAVRLADLFDLVAQGGLVGAARDADVDGDHQAHGGDGARRARTGAEARAPHEGADRQGQEKVAEEQEGLGECAHWKRMVRLPGWNRPSIGVSELNA